MAAFLPILFRLLPYLVGVGLLVGGWLWLDRSCWSTACVTKARQLQTSADELQRARERATALALLWSESINRVEVRYVERQQEASEVAGRLRDRIDRGEGGNGGSGIRIPPVAVGLLRDIADFANSPAASRVDQGSAQAVPEAAGRVAEIASTEATTATLADWTRFALDAAEAYRDAADKHLACVAAYEAIRNGIDEIPESRQ